MATQMKNVKQAYLERPDGSLVRVDCELVQLWGVKVILPSRQGWAEEGPIYLTMDQRQQAADQVEALLL
jgi:hypothetical protein